MPQAIVPLISLGLAGAGTVGNLVQGQKQLSLADQLTGAQTGELNWMQQYQKFLQSLTPADISRMVNEATGSLSSNLIKSVTDPVQATLAEKGLGQAPGTLAQAESVALAPYQQNEQQMALQSVMQLLGLPLETGNSILAGSSNAANAFPAPANTSGAWQMFLNSLPKKGGGGGAPSVNNPGLSINTSGYTPDMGALNADTFNAYTGMAA